MNDRLIFRIRVYLAIFGSMGVILGAVVESGIVNRRTSDELLAAVAIVGGFAMIFVALIGFGDGDQTD